MPLLPVPDRSTRLRAVRAWKVSCPPNPSTRTRRWGRATADLSTAPARAESGRRAADRSAATPSLYMRGEHLLERMSSRVVLLPAPAETDATAGRVSTGEEAGLLLPAPARTDAPPSACLVPERPGPASLSAIQNPWTVGGKTGLGPLGHRTFPIYARRKLTRTGRHTSSVPPDRACRPGRRRLPPASVPADPYGRAGVDGRSLA